MGQSAFTIVTQIEGTPSDLAALEALLNEIGDDIAGHQLLRFADLADLHFASFSVVATDGDAPLLVFEGNIDGPRDDFLRQLVSSAGPAVDQIYSSAAGYPKGAAKTPGAVVDYLLRHDIGANTFFVAWPGWNVDELRREQQLRDRIEALIDSLDPAVLADEPPEAIRARIAKYVRDDPDLAWAATPVPVPFLVRHGGKVVALLGISAALALVGVGALAIDGPTGARVFSRVLLLALVGTAVGALVALTRKEAADRRNDAKRDPGWQAVYDQWSEHIPDISQREDVQVQNHMISVTRIKAGWFRHAVLRIVLWVINLTARVIANQGQLGGIATIHFARWVIAPDHKRLIFLSNYDGSWESYLNEFIDRASKGLTAVWSNSENAVGFPPARLLVGEGARDEVRFKAFGRFSMVPTNTWYSAYPTLTIENIRNNIAIRRGLFAPRDDDRTRAWLRRL